MKEKRTAMCAIIKNEHRYIKEWVEYYLNLGVNEIYLYEDYGSDSHKELLKDYPQVTIYSFTEILPYNFNIQGMILQNLLYKAFLKRVKKYKLFDWVMFFDIDEYLMFEDGYNLQKLEKEFDKESGLWLSWRMFGANGHIRRPEGKLMDVYTKPSNFLKALELKFQFKSMVNIKHATGMHNHHTVVKGVHTNGNRNRYSMPTYEKAWINHYYTKSFQDWQERLAKGNLGNNLVNYENFLNYNPELVEQLVIEE